MMQNKNKKIILLNILEIESSVNSDIDFSSPLRF